MTLTLIDRAATHGDRTAIVSGDRAYTYTELLQVSGQLAHVLLAGAADLGEQRVAFLVPAGFPYVAIQWAIWRAGGIAVPLCLSHPQPELDYVIGDCGATILVADPALATNLQAIAVARHLRLLLLDVDCHHPQPSQLFLPDLHPHRRALILYTSGTTGKPKGVVITHENLQAQVTSLVTAWAWHPDDRILHVLPLHHIHGIVNALTCALWVGAACYMLPKFEATQVWQQFGQGHLTLFMAVPTIYAKLIARWQQAPPEQQRHLSVGCRQMRLMVSGSAALPVQVLEQWRQISGHFLLERYGMTEIGMALSNPLIGERRGGFVGQPLPGVMVRLVDEHRAEVAPGTAGEIQVKGAGVFREYWQKPESTALAFQDDWFCTGDLAVVEAGDYRILGRISTDILKTGGYKVSALEIEAVLRDHPAIQDCAIVGLADLEWGERVAVALVLQPGRSLTLEDLRAWARDRLAVYKIPTRMITLETLPRNAMGKVIKPAVAKLFGELSPTAP